MIWKKNYDIKTKSSIEQYFEIIFTVLKKSHQRRKVSVEVRKLVLFSALIRFAFGNKVSLTPKLILPLERATFSLFLEKNLF